jgi:hypothetical protein
MADGRIVAAIGAEWKGGHEVEPPLAAALAELFAATGAPKHLDGESVQKMARRGAEEMSVARYRVKVLLAERGIDVD